MLHTFVWLWTLAVVKLTRNCIVEALYFSYFFIPLRYLLFECILTLPVFCRVMLCKRGLSRHAVSVCLSVCPSVRHVRTFC